ncbi:dynamin family protein [Pseudomonas sp. WPR_5_2]|uniref:dynamin family protein n=1 Tax=Pseudomonas sp. WPR_5_2 TaxID=1907371 RepID=UPI000EAFE051|nr:dynamin family protein [Pseudomonas sp. WPR_5_2]RKS28516.1 dynamin family protein [Pseudomonas sp. WPR_5_2]
MSQPNAFLSELLSSLPTDWHEPVEALAAEVLHADSPLRLVLLGSFSVGKSSLLNMLLQEPLLQTALEETTALPTFIEYAPERGMSLIGLDGSQLPLDGGQFAHVTTHAPEGAACAVLGLPQPWLKGVSIIDLPGLGSTSASHREYTLSQVRQADAVLYLLSPRGPSAADMDTLKIVQQSGKRVKVLVTHWDEVEEAIARGEKAPSFEQWTRQIESATGLRVRLAASHREGLGREEILEFVQRARDDLQSIRLRRFQAELRPLLQNALGHNAEQQRACEVDSEQQAQALHQELIERKQRLAEFKSSLYGEQQADRARLSQQAGVSVRQQRQNLAQQLDDQAGSLVEETDWERFGRQGSQQLDATLRNIASLFCELSQNYGTLELPATDVVELNLRLPAPETVSAEDFIDIGRLTQLQQALNEQQDAQQAISQKQASLQVQDMDEHEQSLQALTCQQETLATQPLPMTLQQTGNANGAFIGRLVGEVADIGLMFVNPAAAGAKIAALIGKGAKVAKIAVNTGKLAKTISTTVKVVKGAQQGNATIKGVPQPIMDKLGGLEMLSLSYWGERVGHALGGPTEVQVVDTQAMAEREAAIAELEQQRQTLRRALARNEDIANERQLTGWALEQSQKEQARLQSELERLKLQAEQKHREALQQLQQERLKQLRRSSEKARTQWLQNFDRQASAMDELLHNRVRSYWEDRVEALLNERLQDIDLLTVQSQASAQDKQAALVRLREHARALEHTLETLH